MATLKQILKAHGFQHKSSSTYNERWMLRDAGKWIGQSYIRLDIRPYERNASLIVAMIGGKKSEIWFGYNNHNHSAKTPTNEQLTRFEALVIRCKDNAIHEHDYPMPKTPRKPAPPRDKLTDAEKANNKIWRWLGEFYVCGFIGKDFRQYLYYHKAGKHIQVADTENVMVYAHVTQKALDEYNMQMTMAEFEAWLIKQGVPKKSRKRFKRSYPLYD